MIIRTLFFASLREKIGISELTVELPRDATRDSLLQALQSELDESRYETLSTPQVSIAINQELVKGEFTLQEGDEVAFLPPITGG
ncbi:MAG: molybdopterin converting factor subunit 1 [Gammaproteobacteria bacterium]|nr:molybdopterin converting factor subunit 1 [Gammaproteobacteria bacterium]